ncbi:MAG TPA: hypothetical protein ENI42_02220 [Thermoplasmatales archaeon]|nr:hypothetical protein [Thermoplasmatales archaeon]
MKNNGDMVALKDRWNRTIDLVVYGKVNYTGKGWNGTAIPNVSQGELLKRRFKNNIPVDTNTSHDWRQNRRYGVGQSDFVPTAFNVKGVFAAFVSPDCGFDVLSNELKKTNETLFLNVYEISNPVLGKTLEKLLHKGVVVKILVEGNPVGGMTVEEKRLLQNLEKQGAKVYVMTLSEEGYRRYGFNHAKYAVIDNETLVIGSGNWDNMGFPTNGFSGNREWEIVVKNKTLVEYFTKVFFEDCDPHRSDILSFDDFCEKPLPCNIQQDTSFVSYEKHFKPLYITANATIIPVLSPDSSREILINLINSARKTIYIEQLYIHLSWGNKINPLIPPLVNASRRGVDVRVILNCNPEYDNTDNLETKEYLEYYGVNVCLLSPSQLNFFNIHTKGVIVDNESVLVSSINWNEQSIDKNREAGVVIVNPDLAEYYAKVFFYDWYSNVQRNKEDDLQGYKNQVFILTLFIIVSLLIIRDWKRRW